MARAIGRDDSDIRAWVGPRVYFCRTTTACGLGRRAVQADHGQSSRLAGITPGRHRAWPASRLAGIAPGRHHAWPASRLAGITLGRVAPNLLDQDFTATGPDKKWGADISYLRTREGWLYLAVVIDLFACRSWAGRQATGCTATWLSPRCAKPWSCAVQHRRAYLSRNSPYFLMTD